MSKEIKLSTWYKFQEERPFKDLDRENVITKLQKDSIYPEFSISEKSGGRSGDFGVEVYHYDLLIGGYEGGRSDGRAAAIYQVTVDNTNGFCQYLSVIMQPNHTEKGFSKEVLEYFDRMNFAPKNTYLPQDDAIAGFRTFKSWINTIVFPEIKLFRKL